MVLLSFLFPSLKNNQFNKNILYIFTFSFGECAAQNYYFALQVILPRLRSYGDNSNLTLSPGSILIKFILNLPDICACNLCPFSSSTLKLVFGSDSTTTPSTSITSSVNLITYSNYIIQNRFTFRYK
mgnify:CR=1 FL=1